MVYKVFRRPSIDLDAKRKSWGMRAPYKLEVGDIVSGHGEIVDMQHSTTLSGEVHLKFRSGDLIYFNSDEVYSFSAGE